MLRLPALIVQGLELRLPLSLAAGTSLAATLVEGTGEDAPQPALIALLREEPCLLAWAVSHLARAACPWETDSVEGIAALLPQLLDGQPFAWSAASLGRKAATWQAFGRQALGMQDDFARLNALLISFAPKLKEADSTWKRQVKNADPATASLARLLSSLPRKICLTELAATNSPQPVDQQELGAAKQRALYFFAYGLSHEINNPLANISLRAQTLQQDEPNPERRRKLAVIQTQVARAHEMIADLMLYAHPPEPQFVECELRELVLDVVDHFRAIALEQQTTLHIGDLPSCLISIDPVQIRAALAALLQNALEAVQGGREVWIGGSLTAGEVEEVELVVRDSGQGIAAEALPHLFDPFYSGREAGRGLGLGLSKCWRIVQLHQGRIEVRNADEGGAEFRIFLPLVRGEQ